MEEKERAAYPGRSGEIKSSPSIHRLCQRRLNSAVTKSECGLLVYYNCTHSMTVI